MFFLNIANASNRKYGAGIKLVSKAFADYSVIFEFPPPGSVSHFELDLRMPHFELEGAASVEDDTLGFRYAGLQDKDTLNVVLHDEWAFTATAFHNLAHQPAAECTVTCADGTKGQRCVLCKSRSGRLMGKICC